jgi:probable phosphoglycerate mutase
MKLPSKTRPPSSALLFADPERPAHIAAHVANVDGASRGNPGPASYAVILRGPDGRTVFEIGKYLGRATNNIAEYYALITALDYAEEHGIARLLVRSDSELMVRQMQGRYKVKSVDLRPLHERAKKLAAALAHFAIEHVPREQNRDADALANLALDNTSSRVASPAAALAPAASVMPAARVQRLRARYSAGALHPLAPLDLAEGEIVEINIEKNSSAKDS